MDKNPLRPKPKPYFPASTQVFSKHSYNKLLKARPKHLQKLVFDRVSNFGDSLESFRIVGIHLKRLTKSVKNIQNLNFVELCQEVIPRNFNKDIIKRCSRVQKISIAWTQEDPKLMFLSYIYLKNLKNLKSLVLDVSDEDRQGKNPKEVKRITSKFFRFLQKTKLERIQYEFQREKISPPQEVLDFSQYPSSLKSWSLSLLDSLKKFKNIVNIEKRLNLEHLQGLLMFEMLTSLPLDLLNFVLESTNDQLKTLVFKVALKDSNHSIEDFLPKTKVLLSRYQRLECLSVASDAWIDLFSVNEYPWKLKKLGIQTQVSDGDYLKKLKEFIGSQQDCIENLNLHLCFEKEPETFIEEVNDLFNRISCLQRLKALKIILSVKGFKKEGKSYFFNLPTGESRINAVPILPSLMNMISELKCLRELSLNYTGADFNQGFERFFQVLQQKRSTLKILEINLAGYRIQKRDLEALATSLTQLKFLEELKIEDFVITDSGFYKYFAETVHRCSALKSLSLFHVVTDIPDRDPQNMIDMLEKILGKSNLRSLHCYEGLGGFKAYGSCQPLRMSQIYKKFPHVQCSNLPLNTYKFELVNRWSII